MIRSGALLFKTVMAVLLSAMAMTWGCASKNNAQSVESPSLKDVPAPRGTAGLKSHISAGGAPEVNLKILKRTDGGEIELSDGDALTRTDVYSLQFQSVENVHVYIFQIDAKQKIFRLFPNPDYSPLENPVRKEVAHRVPGKQGNGFVLDDTTGTERILLMARTEPIDDAKTLCENMVLKTAERKLGGIRDSLPYDDVLIISRYFIHR